MQPISLAEMDGVTLMDRVDTKYVTNEHEIQALLETVKDHYRVLTIENVRCSDYSTLYFDSSGHDAYLQHHNGRLNRQKFRMREYRSTGMCFWEVKLKNNKGRTVKQRIPIHSIENSLSTSCTEFIDSVIGSQPELVPQLQTNFTRITLVDRDCLERVTLDFGLEFSIDGNRQFVPGAVIAEIKQQSNNRGSAVRQQLRKQGIRPLRISKYCLGISLLKPGLKSNRFKSKLRAVSKLSFVDPKH